MDPNEELIGADLCEHKIKHNSVSHENVITSSFYWILFSNQNQIIMNEFFM